MTRPRSSNSASERMSGGSCSTRTGWRVIIPNALTWNTKPGGVRRTQAVAISSVGRA